MSDNEGAPKTRPFAYLLPGLALAVVVIKGILLLMGESGAPEDPNVDKVLAIKPGETTLEMLRTREGDSVSVVVSVKAGAPIDIHIGGYDGADDRQIKIKGVGFPVGEAVREYTTGWHLWKHSRPGVLAITSRGESSVRVQIEVKR